MIEKIINKYDLTQDMLKELLIYYPREGTFVRRSTAKPCGCVTQKSVLITLKGHSYHARHLAWLYVYGEWPAFKLTHKDGDPTNPAIDNLIPYHVTPRENPGIYEIAGGRYVAMMYYEGKNTRLGTFDTLEEAKNYRAKCVRQAREGNYKPEYKRAKHKLKNNESVVVVLSYDSEAGRVRWCVKIVPTKNPRAHIDKKPERGFDAPGDAMDWAAYMYDPSGKRVKFIDNSKPSIASIT
jgi:hypothetical protein